MVPIDRVAPGSSQKLSSIRFFFRGVVLLISLTAVICNLGGCVSESDTSSELAPGELPANDTAATANAIAEKAMVQPVIYENVSQPGPPLVVLPGQFKLANPAFTQKITTNNIADFAELELDKANFKVLERAHLGPLLEEVTLAVNMGDPAGLSKFRRGKFLATRWFVQFDILRAEPVAEAGTEFDGKALGDLITTLAGNKIGGAAAGGIVSSAGGSEEAKIWIIGIKYKIIDASSSSIVKTNYIEDKMEVGGSSTAFMGIRHTEQGGMTMDSMVQRLVQKCVAEIDRAKGATSAVALESVPQDDRKNMRSEGMGASNSRHVITAGAAVSDNSSQSLEGSRLKKSAGPKDQIVESSPDCQELRKNWQLGDSSVMQRYMKECAQ